jgi:hypothetical protein
MSRTVHHDYRGHVALLALWDLELDVHLTDRYLIGNRRLIGSATSGHRCQVSSLSHAANEKATVVFNHPRLGRNCLTCGSS